MNKNIIAVDAKAINNVITNAKVRQTIYTAFIVLGVVIGSIQASGLDAEWLNVATNVYLYLTAALGALALTNTPSEKQIEELEVKEENDDNSYEI